MKTTDWLMQGTHDEPAIDKIFVELCSRLRVAGVPVAQGKPALSHSSSAMARRPDHLAQRHARR